MAGLIAGTTVKRLSTAAQFFTDEEHNEEDEAETAKQSTSEKVVDLLNRASVLTKDNEKTGLLKQVQELIIHKDPELLDNFLDEMIAFQTDRSVDVKKCIIGFMEEACKKDPECLPRVMPSLAHLFADENINVQKKVILSFATIYRSALQWVSKAKSVRSEMTSVWEHVNQIKSRMVEMLDSDNDGVRTHIVKFLEGLTLALSKKSPESEMPKKQEGDLSLDQVMENNRLIRLKKLEEEGQTSFLTLLQFQGSLHISSINLMTVMGALTNIARQRPQFFDQVVQGFEALHVNLPPTLAKSQVSSVRKNLKMQMLMLLRHPMSADFVPQITTLLTDLGATQSEINKALPKEESRKRKTEEPGPSALKKAKTEPLLPEIDDDDDIGMTPWTDRTRKQPTSLQRQTAIDITAEDLLPRLSVQHVADLVLLSMVMLPEAMPAQFQSTYTPIAAAGTDAQIKHISRLLATQLTMAGMGKGVGELKLQAMKKVDDQKDGGETPAYDDGSTSPKQLIQTVVGGLTAREEEERAEHMKRTDFLPPTSAPLPRKGLRQFKLESVTKPLDSETLDAMTVAIFKRILDSERMASVNHIQGARTKILSCLTSQFGGCLKDILEGYIFDDLRNRYDLAFSWLYQEYTNCQNYNSASIPGKAADMSSYDECLTRLLKGLSEMPDQKDGLFHRLILEAPVITDNAMQIIRKFCANEAHTEAGMKTLRDLIMMRPKNRLDFMDVMLTFTASERPEIRNPAIQTAQKLYENKQLRPSIEFYAIKQLKQLLETRPETADQKRWQGGNAESWGEESIKAHLYLYLGLLPANHALIHELANIYTATSADIKRTILRVLEGPVKGMGMDSPELLRLVENCPKGSETLVMRVIHILTDKAVPSPELVDHIRDLYHKRVPDVRFLIPVLNGLSKKEVIAALPKLIKLNPMVVKEVFNRLMGAHITANASYVSPLTPDELLVALHNIDPLKCDMKTIIKAANMCFSERSIYTQEVLAIVMQRLMEQTPLPTLLMRTVIQSLSMYPRLIGFVLNILQRLILKQVWNQKKVWEGFIKCCQRTKPQSFQVLLQLPPAQLSNVFQISPDLRIPLLTHVKSFTPLQLAHIPPEIMHVLETEPEPVEEPMDTVPVTHEIEPEPAPPGVTEPSPSSLPDAVLSSKIEANILASTIKIVSEEKPAIGKPQPISAVTAVRTTTILPTQKSEEKPSKTSSASNDAEEISQNAKSSAVVTLVQQTPDLQSHSLLTPVAVLTTSVSSTSDPITCAAIQNMKPVSGTASNRFQLQGTGETGSESRNISSSENVCDIGISNTQMISSPELDVQNVIVPQALFITESAVKQEQMELRESPGKSPSLEEQPESTGSQSSGAAEELVAEAYEGQLPSGSNPSNAKKTSRSPKSKPTTTELKSETSQKTTEEAQQEYDAPEEKSAEETTDTGKRRSGRTSKPPPRRSTRTKK